MIRAVRASDAEVISGIYNYYISNTVVTFEEDLTSADEMRSRISEIENAELPWLVYQEGESVIGFAYASKWKGRCAYRYSVEVTVYLAHDVTARGIGSQLYTELFEQLKVKSVHVVLGGISLPNEASIALHEKFGMKKAAHFEEVGFKFGEWVDVAYWQGTLS